ncbi:transcription repressor NadR [Clostridium sp. YIM B02551]|uniref:transcription repressor NadR n=1 Tax=Clostridium sp. YIM B02551 TaxID=2910679 RepID=UPI001EEB81AE|nr:transcription repressor NadR [Clostridium sp. YIM B02551]
MNSEDRRKEIVNYIVNSKSPLKGSEIAKIFGVTRQVIVKDIAIIRAAGSNIVATPEGYIMNKENSRYRRILALCHNSSEMINELEIVIKYGGMIEDVIIEHPIYGELKGNLMIRNLNDLNNFLEKYKKFKAKPLSALTEGIHLHTISTENKDDMDMIIRDLEKVGYLLKD